MADQRYIKLRIPRPEEFEVNEYCIPVPEVVVRSGIELLQGFLAQWNSDQGSEPEQEVWDALAISATQMLSALTSAWVQGQYVPIVEPHDAVRGATADVRKEQEQQAPSEHGPLAGPAESEPAAADRDPGWEF